MCQGFWIDSLKFLASFGGYFVQFCIVEPSLDANVFQSVHFVSYEFFAFYVTFIFNLYLSSLCNFLLSIYRR